MNKNILIGLLCIVIVVLAYFSLRTKSEAGVMISPPAQEKVLPNSDSNLDTSWNTITAKGVTLSYKNTWQIRRDSIGIDGAASEGNYNFELPSGNYLNWGYWKCTSLDNTEGRTCVKGYITYLGLSDVNEKNTPRDLKELRDFIAKNQ